MNIDLTKYKLVQPTSVKKCKKNLTMYDITVKDHHTFYIYLDENTQILAHNCDGQHISSLIISFFHKWFPQIIEKKKLYRIITPLVVCDVGKNRKYFYTLDEYEEFSKSNKVTNINYLKGLGSLSLEDWENVMKNKILFSVIDDKSADKFLDIAFGDNSAKRKKWLQQS
jgi:DNA gyrase/topoisomerase IV subunit B